MELEKPIIFTLKTPFPSVEALFEIVRLLSSMAHREFLKVTEARLLSQAKAFSPRLSSETGRITEVSESQCEKASAPIVVRFSENSTFVSLSHP